MTVRRRFNGGTFGGTFEAICLAEPHTLEDLKQRDIKTEAEPGAVLVFAEGHRLGQSRRLIAIDVFQPDQLHVFEAWYDVLRTETPDAP